MAASYAAAVGRWALQALASPAGFQTHSAAQEGYHARNVWPFEQAGIHAAAQAHGLPAVGEVAARTAALLARSEGAPEYFRVSSGNAPEPGGCESQLWTAGARAYFDVRRGSEGDLAPPPLPGGVRGVPPPLASSVYRCDGEEGSWHCPSSPATTLPCSALNDDYCDCPQGEDEPGTAACAHLRDGGTGFWCGRPGGGERGGTFVERTEKQALAGGLIRLDARALEARALEARALGQAAPVPFAGRRSAFSSWWASAQGKAALARQGLSDASIAHAIEQGHRVPSSRVGDGVCDCPGCEDEHEGEAGAAALKPGPTFFTLPAPALMVAGVAHESR